VAGKYRHKEIASDIKDRHKEIARDIKDRHKEIASDIKRVSAMDEQTFMLRFESMRKPGAGLTGSNVKGGGVNRQLLITHAELERQCKLVVSGLEYDERMSASERRRRHREVEDRLERIRSDQKRCKTEAWRMHVYLERTNARHEQERVKQTSRETIQLRTDEERQLDIDDMLDIIDSLPLPLGVKKHIEQPILKGAFRIRC